MTCLNLSAKGRNLNDLVPSYTFITQITYCSFCLWAKCVSLLFGNCCVHVNKLLCSVSRATCSLYCGRAVYKIAVLFGFSSLKKMEAETVLFYLWLHFRIPDTHKTNSELDFSNFLVLKQTGFNFY